MFKNKIRVIASIVLVAIIFSVMPISLAVSNSERKIELEGLIEECIEIKDKAHAMADIARYFGLDDNDTIIQFAKLKWEEANNNQLVYEKELNDVNYDLQFESTWTGPKLTKSKGVNYGPIGKETYYNLNMSGVVRIMRNMGFDEVNYPYWVREDGCKMLGPYIMVAANLKHFPRGSVVECSLGKALVCDTGYLGWSQIDIAVTW